MDPHRDPPSLPALLNRVANTAIGALHNRAELLVIEWQEEKGRLLSVLLCGVGALFLGMMTLVLLTGLIIFLFPADLRLWPAAGFVLVYLGATIAAYSALKARLSKEPFSETVRQVKKDAVLFETFDERP